MEIGLGVGSHYFDLDPEIPAQIGYAHSAKHIP